MATLILLALVMVGVVIVPLLLLKVLIELVAGVVLLPFRILGALAKALGFVLGGAAKLFVGGLGIVGLCLAFVVFAIVIPLLPFVLIALMVWAVAKAFEPSPLPRLR